MLDGIQKGMFSEINLYILKTVTVIIVIKIQSKMYMKAVAHTNIVQIFRKSKILESRLFFIMIPYMCKHKINT